MNCILALDYGEKRVGVAVSDPTGILASPLPFLSAEPFEVFLEAIQKMIQEKQISLILVGMPKNMDGTFGESAKKVQAFIQKLETSISVPIKIVDERLSTVQAGKLLHQAGLNAKKQRLKIDSASAQVLLQQYLDFQF
ncbi:MAG: Holliday junction resolvase RuvX [Verrucomicrobiota bacterium]